MNANRMPLIDAFKAIASQLIVLHHLAAYGPLAGAAREIMPGTVGWFYDYARIAVQVFLVVAGFLAARGMSPQGGALAGSPWPLIARRYLRLAIPYFVAIALAVAGAALARLWMDDEAIPDPPTLAQLAAHALLLQSVLGFDSLSAGLWYIAIDFQLFALMTLLLWAGRAGGAAPALVLAMAAVALFLFNRHENLDNWAIYFFGSYGLGAAAWWTGDRRRPAAWLGVIAGVALAALYIDFRLRIAVALAVALALACSRRSGLLERWPEWPLLAFLGRISYSLFLVHFPVCLLANALFIRLGLNAPGSALAFLALAWAASVAAATLFYRWVEKPSASGRIAAALGLAAGRA
ncbi:MAG: acyltransferase [Dechloromonas sp.]|nr:acyltransferase [Dechloromonas sp.]